MADWASFGDIRWLVVVTTSVVVTFWVGGADRHERRGLGASRNNREKHVKTSSARWERGPEQGECGRLGQFRGHEVGGGGDHLGGGNLLGGRR